MVKSKSRKSSNSKPTNTALYNRVKAQAKRKFKVWPSAYASGWLVKEYKRLGGRYSGKKPSKSYGLGRWFEEKWIDVCRLPKKVPCGRPKTSLSNWKKKYPYCRPSKSITNSTPKTASQLSKAEIKRRCSLKRKSPMKRVIASKSSKRKPRSKSSKRKPRSKSSKRKPRSKSSKRKPRSKSPKRKPRSKSSKRKPRSKSSKRKPRSKSSKRKPRSKSSKRKPRSKSSKRKPRSKSPKRKPRSKSSKRKHRL